MKRKITTSCFAFMTALVALLAFSCSNMNGSSGDSENSIDNKAYISLSVKNEVVRTALPSYELSEFNKFELFGKFGTGAESSIKSWESDTTKTAYDLMKDDRIAIEVGEWTFRLKATNASGVAYEGSATKTLELGANDIEFKIDLITIPESGKGNLSVGISVTTPGELSVVKAALYKNDETGTLVKPEAVVTGGTASFENLDAGSYKVVFNFYDENGLLLGTCPEYAIVVPGKPSSSSVELESLDTAYTITYHDGETSTTAKYTRHTKVVLPNLDAADVSKDGYEFCGWFANNTDAQGYTATAITEIPENTVGAQEFYAKYMSIADVTPIKSVVLNGEVKVGNTLKAIPYTKESDPAESDKFTGEIESYKWYKGEDSNNDGTISDSEWQLIDGATTAEYKILPADLGKSIRAEIVQKYTVEQDPEKKINVVKTGNAAVSSVATEDVEKGTLKEEDITELIKTLTVLYGGNTAESHNSPVIIGEVLDGGNVSVIPASETIKDSQENAVLVTLETALADGQTAPTSSNYVPVTITVKATGYEDVPVSLGGSGEEASPLFVYVKANPITTVPTLKVEDSDNPTITTGYVMIGTGLPTSEEMPYVDGTEDEKHNKVGYIAPSEPCSITVSEGNIGNKNAIKITEITVTGLTDIAVTKMDYQSETDTITLSVTDASSYSDFDWQAVESSALTVTPGDSGMATVKFSSGTVSGTYGVVLTAKTALATYSTTVYITLSN